MMLRPGSSACCPPPPHPAPPVIPAGLSRLPRQAAGFPEYRRALLAAIDGYPALAGWTADSAHDLGVMLLEAWAYVLDVTGFYDALVADRSYLATVDDDVLAREIVALTGYRPRPALVAWGRRARAARGRDPVFVPAATGFRSQPFEGGPAQVFESPTETRVWPQRNRWSLQAMRQTDHDGRLRFPTAVGPTAGSVVGIVSGASLHAARVVASDVVAAGDGEKYRTVTLDPPLPPAFIGRPLGGMRVFTLSLAAVASPLMGSGAVTGSSVVLDALYPMVLPGSVAVIEVDGALHAVTLTDVALENFALSAGSGTARVPLTRITHAGIPAPRSGAAVRVHLVPKDTGRPVGTVLPTMTAAMIAAHGRIEPPTLPLAEAPATGDVIALGQRPRGLLLPGTMSGERFIPDPGAGGSGTLETPVVLLGNTLVAVRGETVTDEVVGSGDARLASQRFRLKKKPLSFIEDASAEVGRSPQIELRVDGIAWTYVESFYGRAADARVFCIDMAPDGTATIVGGDGVSGARFPSGVGNLVATYRYGAGAARPPAGSITQFARAAAGLQRVLQPLDAWGGADAETAGELRTVAPTVALTLGRAVSLADFEAMARSASGVVNAAVAYSWDPGRQTAVVTVWIIADGGDPSPGLAEFLAARAAPGIAIRVLPATRRTVPVFDIAVEAEPGHAPEKVRAAVHAALFDRRSGLLAPRNVPVAAPLFRSVLFAAIHAVPGVARVPSVMLATGPMGVALVPGDGAWLDLLANGRVV
jgi:hypothetical protein